MMQDTMRPQGMQQMAALNGSHLKVLSAWAVKYVLTGLAPSFTRDTGVSVDLNFGTIAGVRRQLEDGAQPDVIIGTLPAITAMEQAGTLLADSAVLVGRTQSGLGVREGRPVPDISTQDRFRQAMLAARSVAYTDPAAGGTSGIYLVGLLERLGIAGTVSKKALLCANGDEVVDRVMAGDAELASTFISEIITRQGMKVVGAYPDPIGHGMSYSAALAANGGNREAARAFIGVIAAPAQEHYLASRGFFRHPGMRA
jgi:molybdate transport system substrate-binding protein